MERLALGLIAAGLLAACNKPGATVNKEPPPASASPSDLRVAPSASAVSSASVAPGIPTLVKEPFAPGGVAQSGSVYAVEGALLVEVDFRVGRVVGDKVEWLKKTIPKENPALGPNWVVSLHGRWPDGIGAVYRSTSGRASMPTYIPLTGVGLEWSPAPGSHGEILGVARVGESTLVGGRTMFNAEFEFKTVRGTAVRKPQTPAQAGCKEGEMRKLEDWQTPAPAISPSVVGATPEGTLISIGPLCEKRGPAAEIWDKSGKSRITDVSRFWKKVSYWPKLLPGAGDEMWAFSDAWSRVLRYHDGEIEAVPDLGWPIQDLFVSARGQLHANDGRTIHRYDGRRWVPVGRLAKPETLGGVAMDDTDTLWTSGVYRLRPGPSGEGPAPEEGCATPFVYLYQVSGDNGPKFTYPATRKALSTFPDVAALGLVEYEDHHRTRLGLTVASMAQGQAVIAHLKEAMKDEDPRLYCFDVKTASKVRSIDMNAAK
jgi:hypothetical protein